MKFKITNDLALDIFDCELDGLSLEKRLFVYMQNRMFNEYREKIKEVVTEIMHKKNLKGRENALIKDWFIRRIPLRVVLNGIKNSAEYASHKGSPIYALGYFSSWVEGQLTLYKKNSQHTDYTDGGKDKWFYNLFVQDKNGELGNLTYDPWIGVVRR